MTEPIITVGLGAVAAYLGKDGISRILGPTADYLGGELKEFTKRRIENVGKIFSRAEKKLGDKLDCPGQVPPKVLKTIINEGSYSDDDITIEYFIEYFGGVLASSRTEISRDDRGSRLVKMIDNMSTYQIRSHYLIYSTISELFSNSKNSFGLSEDRYKMQLFMPGQGYVDAMEFTQQEWNNRQILLLFTKVCLPLVARDGRSQVSYLDDVVTGQTVDRRVVAWPRRYHRSCCADAV